jgi:hypothetical protein
MRSKYIVTNCSVLKKKYADFAAVKKSIDALIAADRKRDIDTRLFDVSDAATMTKAGGKAVTTAKNSKQNKNAIDAIYTSAPTPPDYLMILGSVDVIPHQDLANPELSDDDPDEHAWGDLPYACDAPYSTSILDFTAPTRVVGRLPDIDGAKDSTYLRKLLKNAASWTSRSASDYKSFFAVTAETWKKSTRLSMKKTFGSQAGVFISPKAGPGWTGDQLAPLSHFINCHGAEGRSEFYGEDPTKRRSDERRYPIAHQTTLVRSKIKEGTVAAVECCYGAQLYKPDKIEPEHGICQEYLHGDAYAFLGSTTIAYGLADDIASADLICASFLQHVLEGSSTGLAALQARQDFVKKSKLSDPADLKTLGQFNLLGDPSIHPVASKATAKPKPKGKGLVATAAATTQLNDDGHRERRAALRERASALAAQSHTPRAMATDPDAASRARAAVAEMGLNPGSVKTFAIDGPPSMPKRAFGLVASDATTSARIHAVTLRDDDAIREARRPPGFSVAILREEPDGTMQLVRRLYAK